MREFNTVGEWLRAIESPTDMADYERKSITGTEEFTQTASLDEAIRMARIGGFKDGIARIAKLRGEILRRISGQLPAPRHTLVKAHARRVNFGRYLSGRPDCLVKTVDSTRTRNSHLPRVVRVVVNLAASGAVNGDTLIMRGVAAVVLADVLQRHGSSVSIEVTHAFSSRYVAGQSIEYRVAVKRSNELVSLDKLAFLLGHPSALRRLFFATEEHEDMATRQTFGISRGRGYGIPAQSTYQGDVYIPAIESSSEWSEGFTLAWLRKQLVGFGLNLKEV
jgi:hypothetical protein